MTRLLVCAPLMPEYDREGGSRRLFDHILLLREAGFAVSFIPENPAGGVRYARMLQQLGVAVYGGFNSQTDRLIGSGKFDLALFTFWNLADRYMPRVRSLSPSTRIIVDSVDLHFLRQARRAFLNQNGNRASGLLGPAFGAEIIREINTYAASDAVMTVSQKEADLLNDFFGNNDLVAEGPVAYPVVISEDLELSPIPLAQRKGILFLGNFRHPPNIQAAEYLCKAILPKLSPEIVSGDPIYIVGNALDDTICGYAKDLPHNVRMVGWVPSVLPYLQRVKVSVIPLRYGAGVKTKLVQALMVGTPSVTTSVGVEGLGVRNGDHVLVADDPDSFAQSIARLLHDTKLWQHLAQEGHAHISALNGREVARKQLLEVVERVLGKKSGQGSGESGRQLKGQALKWFAQPINSCDGPTITASSNGAWKSGSGLWSMMKAAAGYVGFGGGRRQRYAGSEDREDAGR